MRDRVRDDEVAKPTARMQAEHEINTAEYAIARELRRVSSNKMQVGTRATSGKQFGTPPCTRRARTYTPLLNVDHRHVYAITKALSEMLRQMTF